MSRDNVGALIDADKAVHEEMRQRYPDGPYQDGMYGTGMLLELGRLGFVVVPTSDWQRLLADTPSVEVDDGDGGCWKGIDGEGRAIRPSVEPGGLETNEHGRVDCAACGYSVLPKTWANHLLGAGHLRNAASDSPEPDSDVESCVRWAMTHYDQALDGDLSAKDVVGLSAFIARHLSERIEAEASDSPEKTT